MNHGDALLRFAAAHENDLLRLTTQASAHVGAAVFAALAEKGHTVRPSHVPVFSGLDRDGTNISSLAHRAGISRQAMSGLVRDVESEGYVRTIADPADRRALMVELTEKGARFCDDAVQIAAEVAAQWRTRLGASSYDAMIESLREIGQ
jgi:DNA-binding MarR family transcriptional regulator